jgi:hypothetical protein
MTVDPLNELTREKFNINKRVKTGVTITQFEAGSTAKQDGLRPGDDSRHPQERLLFFFLPITRSSAINEKVLAVGSKATR